MINDKKHFIKTGDLIYRIHIFDEKNPFIQKKLMN